MKKLLKNFEKKHGYKPTKHEVESLYRSGCLILSDKEEDELLKWIEQ